MTTSRLFTRSAALRRRFHSLIPGGAHTYAKGDDQYPQGLAPYLVRGRGCRVWDVDGNEFIEYGMGLRAVTLGHAFQPVLEAVLGQLQRGSNFTRPALIELECAEEFMELFPHAEMVKFCKDGSTAIDAAVRLARAHTGRDMIAFCGDHPFFSTSDWFIGTTEMDGGIPQWNGQHTVKFRYNDLDSLERLFAEAPRQIACVVMEAARTEEPRPGFLGAVRDTAHKHGALFILDEMITGFRWHVSGAQHVYDVEPDLSAFGKALGNGFAVSALTGKRFLMERGGIQRAGQRVFLLSTTHGAESHGLAAAMATMRFHKSNPVIQTLYARGEALRAGISTIVENLKLGEYFELLGRNCNLVYVARDAERRASQAFRTLFLQEIIMRGVLAPSFVVSYSHSESDIAHTVEVVGDALQVYRKAIDDGVEKYLRGRPVKPVFRRFA